MKHARIAYAGAIHDATSESAAHLRLDDGRLVSEDSVVWLPPVVPGIILALGLNYIDHAKELKFEPPTQPLAFSKTCTSLVGHRGQTRRPSGVTFMHYECELAVVIGKTARSVSRRRAHEFIAGYTVANDYAIRDYLENYYRPNMRAKSRDESTPLGPWLVDASDVPDPQNLRLTTTVNGRLTQQGSTKDMVFDIATLIEHFTNFMTLQPGDIILTGTPEGLADVQPGDEVATEIEGVGRLINTIVEDWTSLTMPHFIVEYTSNIKAEAKIPQLLAKANEILIAQGGLFPVGGIRSRAIELDDYCIADGQADYAFVHCNLKIGAGRTEADKKRVCGQLFDAIKNHFSDLFAKRYLALSLELNEFSESGTYKHNNIHARFRAATVTEGSPQC